jgi:cobalamin synthase
MPMSRRGEERNGQRAEDDGPKEASLEESVSNLLEEARILLPGTQTLFGFQLIVVFNQSFHDRLSATEQWLHLIAIVLTTLAIALLMAPATYHRQAEPDSVSRRFLRLATVQLVAGTAPLAAAICLEVYLVAQISVGNPRFSLALALALALVFAWLWYALPRRRSQ